MAPSGAISITEFKDRLSRVQQASGNFNQAIPTLLRVAALQPDSALPHLRLAEAHMANKNVDAAVASGRRAMEADPRSLPAQRTGIALFNLAYLLKRNRAWLRWQSRRSNSRLDRPC